MSIYNGMPPGAVGPMGAIGASSPAGANGPPGPIGSLQPIYVNSSNNNSALTFMDHGEPVLVITKDGDVEWHGKPSQGAKVLEDVLGNLIDGKAASAAMRQRTYLRACKVLLSKARSMSREELIEHLELSIDNRNSKAVLLALEELSEMEDQHG